MSNLHIVQGGIANKDKQWIERAARNRMRARSWVVPMAAVPGDEIVIYIAGFGFFATAVVESFPKPRLDWQNRYGAQLGGIRLIRPAISLATIQRKISALTWANYPRSITTPSDKIAQRIRRLIFDRRESGIPDLDDQALEFANIDELRRVALLKAKPRASKRERTIIQRARSRAIHLYVLARASGECEACNSLAPFVTPSGSPYLEPHHITRLSDEGPDHPASVIGLCPNCHRRAHYAADADRFNAGLRRKIRIIERKS